MFLCLSQWLETNPNSENLQILSSAFRSVGIKFIEQLNSTEISNQSQQHQLNR
jgi:hypothetical protein